MNIATIAAVGLGGAIGAVLRYLFGTALQNIYPSNFPYQTIAINIIGSLIMGLLIGLMAFRWSAPPELRAFLTVGVLGGFTTFSAFSLDAVLMIETGQWRNAFLYIVLSVLLSTGALFLAMNSMRALIKT